MRSHFPRKRGETALPCCLPRKRGSGCAAQAAADEGDGANVLQPTPATRIKTVSELKIGVTENWGQTPYRFTGTFYCMDICP